MIRLEEEKNLKEEIQEAKNKVWEEDEYRDIPRIVHNETALVGYFTVPGRRHIKRLQKKFKNDGFGYLEAIARENLVYPGKERFDKICEYKFGVVVRVAEELLKQAGFEGETEAKNESYPG